MTPPFCNVALPVPLRNVFTYAVPETLRGTVQPGNRVLVPFRKKTLVGVVVELAESAPAGTKVREITRVLDFVPALTPKLIELAQWIKGYYLAPAGEVFRAMLPPVTELKSQRQIILMDAGREAAESLSGGELSHGLTSAEAAFLTELKEKKGTLLLGPASKLGVDASALQRLQRRGLIEIRETVQGIKRRTQRVIAWKGGLTAAEESAEKKENDNAETQNAQKNRREEVEEKGIAETQGAHRKHKEERVRELLETERGPLPLPQLLKLAQVTRAFVERMLRDGMLESWEEAIDPAEDPFDAGHAPPAHELNAEQESALKKIRARLELGEFGVQFLHGVTGSGKTEVYLRAVQETLARGKTALVLVPEIALTLWIGRQCRSWFGARFEGVAVLHSALSDVERAREWWRVRNGEARVVVGTRSAVFAPLENVGLIIVDEEQENSFKQEETPRYHGRDVAIVRAKMEGALALLGSATPSMETYHHARNGKYELLTLASRVADRSLASVEVVDLREDFQQTHQTSPISAALHSGIQECLANGTQVLVLINRRGYSWSVLCRSCGASVQCVNCSISMTHHKQRNRLECHYCGSIQPIPKQCPKCQSKYVYFFGEGSEHLEERLRKEFPGARIARLDRDTARTKRQYQETLGAFAGGALDILVGTQMLAKGHDFQRVTLVGVVSADSSLSLPDFRAAERTFQLLTQVAGRAGRGELKGRVLIQTFYPEHYAIQDAVKQDYSAFFERELNFRRMMAYPPFTSLANVIVRDTSLEKTIRWSRQLSEYFSPHDGESVRILGPATAPLARLKKEHRFQFLLKSPKRSVLTKLLSGAMAYCDAKEIPQTAVLVDMDPLSLL
ncbi:MAG TPA: primosomal protein N' [Candidatus Limnocylindria bacterium]|jgi:primosomal protein N' (replication factor Y)|nr:primosomal protein N' [Candidatus Limnocylindria bacterium]